MEEGIFVNTVVPPAVAPQDTFIRFSVMASHTKDQVDFALEKMIQIAQELGVPMRERVA